MRHLLGFVQPDRSYNLWQNWDRPKGGLHQEELCWQKASGNHRHKNKNKPVAFLTAYKRSKGGFLRERSSPALSISHIKPVAWLEMLDNSAASFPGAPHKPHPPVQILAIPELSTQSFSKTVGIPQLWAAYLKAPFHSYRFFLWILSTPLCLKALALTVLSFSRTIKSSYSPKESRLFWHLHINLLSIFYFASGTLLLSLPVAANKTITSSLMAAADKVPVFSAALFLFGLWFWEKFSACVGSLSVLVSHLLTESFVWCRKTHCLRVW